MGTFGRKVNGKELTEHWGTGRSWKSGKPKYKLDPCPRCGAVQAEDLQSHSPVLIMYAGMGEFGKWFVVCTECDYFVSDKDEGKAVSEWNCEYIF